MFEPVVPKPFELQIEPKLFTGTLLIFEPMVHQTACSHQVQKTKVLLELPPLQCPTARIPSVSPHRSYELNLEGRICQNCLHQAPIF